MVENSTMLADSKILKAMANEKRLKILFCLSEKEINVGDLEKILKISQSALSQHLAVLREANIVKTKRVAQEIYYSIVSDKAIGILKLLRSYRKRRY